jgi:hypothetical protein
VRLAKDFQIEKDEQLRYAKNAILPTRHLPEVAARDTKVRARSEAKKKVIIHKEIQQY